MDGFIKRGVAGGREKSVLILRSLVRFFRVRPARMAHQVDFSQDIELFAHLPEKESLSLWLPGGKVLIEYRLKAGAPLRTRLAFQARLTTPPGFLHPWLLARYSRVIQKKFDSLAARIYWRALETKAPLDYPSLSPANFQTPGRPIGLLFEKLTDLPPVKRVQAVFRRSPDASPGPGDRGPRPPVRRYRRMLVLPLSSSKEELARILPPPFLGPELGPGLTTLYFTVCLDAGVSEHIDLTRTDPDAPDASYPDGRNDFRVVGRENRLMFEVLAPARIRGTNFDHRGYLPLFAGWTPLFREPTARDPYSAVYNFKKRVCRFSLGDSLGRLQMRINFSPGRVIRSGDGIPGFLMHGRTNRFRQDRDDFSILLEENIVDYTANRVYLMRPLVSREPSPASTSRSILDAAEFFSQRLGLDLQNVGPAFFLGRLDIISHQSPLPLWNTIYRKEGAARRGSLLQTE